MSTFDLRVLDLRHGKNPDSGEPIELLPLIHQLSNSFNGHDLVRGGPVAFVWRLDGSLVVSINDHVVETLTGPAVTPVARALFDVYLGESAVSQEGRDAINSGLVRLHEAFQ
jgi:hypothetical protein